MKLSTFSKMTIKVIRTSTFWAICFTLTLMSLNCSRNNTNSQKTKIENLEQVYIEKSFTLLELIQKKEYDEIISNLDGKFKGIDVIKKNIDRAAFFIEEYGLPTENNYLTEKKLLGPGNEVITITFYLPSLNNPESDRIQFYYFYKETVNPKPIYIIVHEYLTKEEKMKLFRI